MSKKFSIIKIIDLDKLDEEIKEYKRLHQWDENPYIFMNESTARAIESEIGTDNAMINAALTTKIKNDKNGVYAIYNGYKMYINNDLNFGIVEIR